MRTPDETLRTSQVWIAVVMAGVIFYADVTSPLGIAMPILYVGPILLGLLLPNRLFTLGAATVGSVLTVAGFFLSPPGGIVWIALLNRGLVIASLWATAAVVVLCEYLKGEVKALREMMALCASCKKIRDDTGFWTAMEGYVEAHYDVLFQHSLCPACQMKWETELLGEEADPHEQTKEAS